MRFDALIGFSANVEEVFTVISGWDQPKCLGDFSPMMPAGTSFNVAKSMRLAGATVKLLATVGRDHLAILLERMVRQEGIDVAFLPIREGTPRTISVIPPAPEPQRLLRFKPEYQTNGFERNGAFEQITREVRLADPHLLVVTGVTPRDFELVAKLLVGAKDDRYRVLDFDVSLASLLVERELFQSASNSFCDLLVLNNLEAARLLKRDPLSEADLPQLLEFAPEVIVTWNSHGVYYLSASNQYHQEAFRPKRVVDDTGAGDCFLGYFLASRRMGCGIPESLRVGAASAALKIERLGGSNIPCRAEVQQFLTVTAS